MAGSPRVPYAPRVRWMDRGSGVSAHNMRLPDFVIRDIEALEEWDHQHALKVYATCLRNAGWSGRSITKAFRRNVNWAYQHHLNDRDVERSLRDYRLITGLGLTVPAVPPKNMGVKIDRRKLRKRASPEMLQRLRELQDQAQRYRGVNQNREAAQEYTRLLWQAITVEGITAYSLAKDLDITHAAIQSRLVRYGYRTTRGTSGAYRPLSGRSPRGKRETCNRGHLMTGNNLRIISTTGARVCKTCERIRVKKYKSRKQASLIGGES